MGGWIGTAKLIQHIHRSAYDKMKSTDVMRPEHVIRGWMKPYLVDSSSYLWPFTWVILLLLLFIQAVIGLIRRVWERIKDV